MSQRGLPPSPTALVDVELADQVARFLGATPEEVGSCLRLLACIDLVRRGEVTSGWVAERLGMTKAEFRAILSDHEVPYLDIPEEELRKRVEAALPRVDRSRS